LKESKALVLKEFEAKVISYMSSMKSAVYAQNIAEELGISKYKVYQIIKRMRFNGVGVHTTWNGYVLSKYATKKEDVGFIRGLLGRRASDYHALKGAKPHINRRWRKSSLYPELNSAMTPLIAPPDKLNEGMKSVESLR